VVVVVVMVVVVVVVVVGVAMIAFGVGHSFGNSEGPQRNAQKGA
jgi:hypothetical protein